ncbi:MAG: ribonuclease HIII [Puniceicoccales bacterium]|jgi:ribonuclease HIII|nr:ribonuclease HIII [Puniceicoccales bacterium]
MGEKPMALHSCSLDREQMQKLENSCESSGWESYSVAFADFAYRGPKVNVVAYRSGKVVVQGKGTEEFVKYVLEPEIIGECHVGYEELQHPDWFQEHGGMDESGKGDLFGPLVSACVIAGGEIVKKWRVAGVRDCKSVGQDGKIFELDRLIRTSEGAVVEVFSLSMKKYNELYGGFGENLNRLLAWYHSKSLANALQRKKVSRALLDQFSRQPLVQSYFPGNEVTIEMRPRAEEDIVVAAASIVARAEFLRAMERLSTAAGEKLLRGAGAAVQEQARSIVRRLGAGCFGEFAKLHFSTAQRALFS